MKCIFALGLLISAWVINPPAFAGSSAGSMAVSQGVAIVLYGTVSTFAGSGQVIVESVKTVPDSTYIVLKSLPELSEATIKIAGSAVGASSVAVGESLKLMSHAAGTLIVKAGEVLAIIPNELGKNLLLQTTH